MSAYYVTAAGHYGVSVEVFRSIKEVRAFTAACESVDTTIVAVIKGGALMETSEYERGDDQ